MTDISKPKILTERIGEEIHATVEGVSTFLIKLPITLDSNVNEVKRYAAVICEQMWLCMDYGMRHELLKLENDL